MSDRSIALIALWLPVLAFAMTTDVMPVWVAAASGLIGFLTSASIMRDTVKGWPRMPGDGQRKPGKQ